MIRCLSVTAGESCPTFGVPFVAQGLTTTHMNTMHTIMVNNACGFGFECEQLTMLALMADLCAPCT